MAFPPPDEQAAIVRYLDHADRRISRYIRAKQRLIELLEEEKQAIIHRAVTRGLDPDVRLKPSGVEWLGDIPEHWDGAADSRNVMHRLIDSLQGSRRFGRVSARPLQYAEASVHCVVTYLQRGSLERSRVRRER